MYVVQPLSRDLRRATGDYAAAPAVGFVLESALAPSHVLGAQGVVTESQVVAPYIESGAIIPSSSKGDRYTVEVEVVSPTGGIRHIEVTQVDVGGGANALQTVTSSIAAAQGDAVTYAEASASESEITANPALPTLENTVPPDPIAVAPDETTYIVQPEYVSAAPYVDGSYYVASGGASATQDLISYGEYSAGGYVEPVYDPLSDPAYVAGIESQYA